MLRGLFCLALLALARADDIDESAVEVLGDDTLEDFVKNNDKVLVEFYAPWCGHCKALKPKWAEAAKTLADDDSIPTKLAMVDATQNQASASKYGVSGYPTIKYFDGGEVEDYDGPRDTSGIITWVKSRARPVVSIIKKKDVDGFASSDDFVVFLYAKKDSKKIAKFERLAKKNRDKYTFARVVLKKGKARVAFRRSKFTNEIDGGATIGFDGKWSKLGDWLDQKRFQTFNTIGELGVSLPQLYSGAGEGSVGAVIMCNGDDDENNADAFTGALTSLVQEHTGKGARWAFLSWAKKESMATGIGCDGPGQIVVVDDKGNKMDGKQNKFVFKGDLNSEAVSAWLATVSEGKADRWFKSEDTPEGDELYDNGVEILVGNTFQDAISDTESDILVEFYAPWCGHCKKYKPEYEKLARFIKRTYKKPIRIAKVDAVNNEVDAPVRGYPTILFYPGGRDAEKGTFVKYEGNRDQDDVVDFIEENAWSLTSDYKGEL